MWHGHLCVAVEAEWLLDPTLDQANRPEWGAAHRLRPLAVRVPETFWTDRRGHVIEIGELNIRYAPYRRPQSGFASAGDARPSHWRPVVERALARIMARAA